VRRQLRDQPEAQQDEAVGRQDQPAVRRSVLARADEVIE
jgi:hypothetical protein